MIQRIDYLYEAGKPMFSRSVLAATARQLSLYEKTAEISDYDGVVHRYGLSPHPDHPDK